MGFKFVAILLNGGIIGIHYHTGLPPDFLIALMAVTSLPGGERLVVEEKGDQHYCQFQIHFKDCLFSEMFLWHMSYYSVFLFLIYFYS